jgi:tight adherence protein B
MPNFFVLLSISVILGLALLWVRRSDRLRQFVHDRTRSLTIGTDDEEPTLHLARQRGPSAAVFQFPRKVAASLDAAFEAAGKSIGLLHLIIAGLIAPIIVMPFVSRILGLSSPVVIVAGCLAAAAAPALVIHIAQVRYRNRFLDVFPDALDLIRRAVRAGLPVNEAVAAAGREIGEPVGSELRRAVDQMQIGVQMVDALQETADRIRVADFRFLVVALALQGKTGGSLAETLANLSGVIRARRALRLKARALSAEARASAAVLAVLPFVVGGLMYIMNRDLTQVLLVDPRGRFMVGLAFLSLATGLTTMYVMVKRALR